jgi:CubicO group peptidase (beta-lactamase class C family)
MVDEVDLTALLREHASMHAVPGATIGILRQGEATIACCGVADVVSGQRVTAETRFSTGSLTKSMVATVIARLAEDGRLSLDDPVAGHVPELRGSDWAQRATLRDLLSNRSGLPLSTRLEFGFGGRSNRDHEGLAGLAADVAAAGPGPNIWSYANVGWCLLGRVIETVTGDAWETALRHHVVEPMGMRGVAFSTDGAVPDRASGHDVTGTGPVPVEPLDSRAYGPAGTSVVATATDLLRFAALHLEDSSLATLRVVHAPVSIFGWIDSWCLGWARFDWDGGQVWGWDGVVDGERSILRILPEQRAAIVLMTNSSTGRAMYRSLFADLTPPLLGIGLPPMALSPSPDAAGDPTRFAGTYAWPDRRVEVTAAGSGLLIKSEDGETEAVPLDGKTFLVDPLDPDTPTVTFGAFDDTGRPGVLYLMLWGLPRLGR